MIPLYQRLAFVLWGMWREWREEGELMDVPQLTHPPQPTTSPPPRPPADSPGPVVLAAIREAFAARLSSSPKACAVVFQGHLLAITSRPHHRMARYPVGAVVVRVSDGAILGTRVNRSASFWRVRF